MAFLLLRIPLAAEVEGAALAVGHLTANLLIPDCTFGEILDRLVKKKIKRDINKHRTTSTYNCEA